MMSSWHIAIKEGMRISISIEFCISPAKPPPGRIMTEHLRLRYTHTEDGYRKNTSRREVRKHCTYRACSTYVGLKRKRILWSEGADATAQQKSGAYVRDCDRVRGLEGTHRFDWFSPPCSNPALDGKCTLQHVRAYRQEQPRHFA